MPADVGLHAGRPLPGSLGHRRPPRYAGHHGRIAQRPKESAPEEQRQTSELEAEPASSRRLRDSVGNVCRKPAANLDPISLPTGVACHRANRPRTSRFLPRLASTGHAIRATLTRQLESLAEAAKPGRIHCNQYYCE